VSTRTWYAFGSQGMAKQATTDGPDWFHGSGATFGRFDMDQDRGHQYGAKHWNSYVGSHFSSEHHTAANLAHESAVGTTPGAVYHATLSAKRTKHYFAEHDMDQEAKSWAEDNGHDYNSAHLSPESWLRYHPKVKEVAHGFRDHLKSQGYDGVTYGNEYEGSHLHECAIAFHPDDITITHRHTPEEDCDAGDEICPDCGHHYEGGSMGHCDKCGAPVGMEGDDDEDEHHYGSRPTEAPTTWYAFGSLAGTKTAAADEPGWYHGSGSDFSRFDLDRNRKHMGWNETKHWNGFVGSHFTSEHHTAANVAEEQEREGAQARVYHVNLAMKNPKHYDSEHDMDEEAKTWAKSNGHDHKESAYSAAHWLRHHPQVKEVAHGFRDHLKAQGHDGITYGNVFEGSYGHKCAIAFGSDDIDITKAHSLENDCGNDNRCPECHRYYPGDFEGYCPECDHWIGEDKDDHDDGHLAHLGALTQHFGMASNSQEHNRAFGYDHPRPTYVRFGDWPADERSMNHITGHKEEGVSVYDLDKHGDPMDPDYDMDRGQHHEGCEPDCDYWDHDEDNTEFHDDTADMLRGHLEDCRRGHNTSPDRRAHLVQGDYVTHGHDDEPVLNHLKTVGHWPCDVHKFVPTAERRSPSWCYHPDHDQDDGDEGEDDETHGHLGTLTQHFASDEDDLDFRDSLERFMDLLAETTTSPGTRKMLTDPESRGRIMNKVDEHTPRYVPGTFERHIDDQLKGKEAAKDEDPKETLKWLLKELGPRYNPPEKTDEQKAAEDADHQRRVTKHEEWQAQRKGYSPGDDLSDWDGYPHAEWVPIQVAQRFREHTGDQHKHSERTVAKIAGELKAGRGMTDPLMLLHHNEANRASLGEGNHRLKAAERAGWTHVPMRAVRMYDGEADEGKGQSIPHSWRGSHQGRTPEMCKPSDVLSPEVMGTQHKTAAQHPGPHYHGTKADLEPGDLIRPGTHPPTWPDESDEPRQHVYFSPRLNYVTENYGPNVYEVEPTGDYTHDAEYNNRRMFKSVHPLRVVRQVSGKGSLPKESRLSLEDVISVAEHSMHEAGNHGREWHLPTSKEYPKRFDNPDYWEAMKPVNQFVHAALRHGGHPNPESIRTVNSDYDLDRAGGAQGLTDGLNSIHVRDHTNDLTLLHEVAHVLNRTHEGEGHDRAFADTARDLYHHFISPKAAEHFHGIVSHHPAYLDSDRSTKDSGVKEAHREEVGREGHHPGGPGVDRPEGRHRGARPGRGRLRARAARPGDAGTGPPSPRPLTWHPKAVKDVKRLDKPVQKAVQAALDGLASGDPTVLAQTHPMSKGTPLQGWSATKVSRGHRIVHQPTQDGGLHIGYVGLHDYGEAIRRLTSIEQQTMLPRARARLRWAEG
jgi:hypothetical protein